MVDGTGWVGRLRLDEFRLLNRHWAGEVPTLVDAVLAFEHEGVERLAPLSFADRIDPAYYREVHPEYAALSDVEVHLQWLHSDLRRDWPGSPESHLRSLGLALSDYPAGFDWRGYTGSRELVENRWFALQHLVENGLEPRDLAWLGEDPVFAAALGMRFRGRDDDSAILALDRARELGDRSYATLHQLADAWFRTGDWPRALTLFSEAATHPEAGVWTFVNGARAAMRMGRFRRASALLEAGRGAASGRAEWRGAVQELVEACFAARTRRARTLYGRPAGRARADRLIGLAVREAAEVWEALDPVGAPLGVPTGERVVILANYDIQACVDYRVEQKVEQLAALGHPCAVYRLDQWEDFLSALPGSAAAIFFRLPAWPSVTRTMGLAAKLGVPTYYDIDDLIFDAGEYPDPIETYGGQIDAAHYEALLMGVPLFRLAAGLCDYAIAPTSALARRLEPIVREGRAFVVPNGLDRRHETLALPFTGRGRGSDTVTIFYASGTPAHTSDFNEIAGPALVEVLAANPHARLVIVGRLVLSPIFDAVRGQVEVHGFTDDLRALWGMLAEADINLAVLNPSPATDAKSEIKWLEAAILGVPSIVSATATYREVLEPGVDALLAATTAEWKDALDRLVTDGELRRAVGLRARAAVVERYSRAATARSLETALAPAFARRAPFARTPARKRRVLLAGDGLLEGGSAGFSAPLLDALLYADLADIELAILTDDPGGRREGRRVEARRGAPVLRLAVSASADEELGSEAWLRRNVGEFLEAWRPDLVHFGDVARLTIGAVDACRIAGLPYLISASDEAWLSEPEGRKAGFSMQADAAGRDRARRLGAALGGAEAVLTPAEAVARACRSSGARPVEVIPPDVRQLPGAKKQPEGPVRLLHLRAGDSPDGFDLIEGALRGGRYRHLELVAVDLRRDPSETEHRVWGGTPVRIVGGLNSGGPPALLEETDVLLALGAIHAAGLFAPGEALSLGSWVVTREGATGGDLVQHGRNGFIVGREGDLSAVFAAIEADPGRFKAPPALAVEIPTVARQAAEIIGLYRTLLGGAGAPG